MSTDGTDGTERTFTCAGCGSEDHWLTEFPNSTCLACYTLAQESQPMPTAAQVVAMWGGPTARRRTR
jgi:hypothetical protein